MASGELLLSVNWSGLSCDAQRLCVAADWHHFSGCLLLWHPRKLLLMYRQFANMLVLLCKIFISFSAAPGSSVR